MLSQPMDRAMPDARTAGGSSRRRTGGPFGQRAASPAESACSKVKYPAQARAARRSRAARVDGQGARALRAEQPLLAGDRVDVGAGRREVDRDGAGALGAIDDDQGAARVGDVGDRGDRHDRPGRPQDVADHDGPRALVDGGVEGGDDPLVVAAVADVEEVEVDAVTRSRQVQRADAARVLEAGGHGLVAGRPVDPVDADVHAVGRGVGEGDVVDRRR